MIKSILTILFVCLFSCANKPLGPPKNPHLSVGRLETYKHIKVEGQEDILIDMGNGTGFAISPHEIMTADHICEALNEKDTSIYLIYFDGKDLIRVEEEMIPIARDAKKDLCILFLYNNPLRWIDFSKDKPNINDTVYTYGFPRGIAFTLTSGFYGYNINILYKDLSGKDKTKVATSLSLPAYYGNSGGPLFNNRGEFVGVLIAIYKPYFILSYTPTYEDIKTFLQERYK